MSQRDRHGLLDGWQADWRLARRALKGSPLFALIAIGTLTVAIGLSTAVFSLVESILLRPLPYPHSDRLVRLAQFRPDTLTTAAGAGSLADVTIGAWASRRTTLDAFAPYSTSNLTVRTAEGPEQMPVASVGGQFFEALSTTPVTGRLISPADDRAGAPAVAVISHRFWKRRGEQSSDIGGAIEIDRVLHTIVGIVPDSVSLPITGVDIWRPGRWKWPAAGVRRNFGMSLSVLARRRADASLADVQREGERVLVEIASADPAFFDGTVAVPRLRVRGLLDDVVLEVRSALMALLLGMALVLVAACVSLANLLLARNTARARDIAIRLTLGASRGRLARPLLLEQLAIVTAGTVAGGLVGWWVLRGLPLVAPPDLPRLDDVALSFRALAVTSGAALVTAIVVGVLPAWRRSGTPLGELSSPGRLRSGSADGARNVLVAGQIALAVVLLVGATLIGRSLLARLHTHPGFQPDHVLTFQVGYPDSWYAQKGRQTEFFRGLMSRLEASPGVTAVGSSSQLPLHPVALSGTFRIEGQAPPPDPADWPRAIRKIVSHNYLDATGTRIVAGRGFAESDVMTSEPVILIDELLARRYFPDGAVGRQVRAAGARTQTIVGVVEATRLAGVAESTDPVLYLPSGQYGEAMTYNSYSGGLVVRTSGDPAALIPVVRAYVRELDTGSPAFNIMPLRERLDRTFAQPRFYTIALGLFAALTLATAVIGIYGLLAYAVERRRMEFGVRRALGADERDIVSIIVRRGVRLAVAGFAVGLPAAAAGAGTLRALLFEITPLDPLTYATVPVAILVVVLLACFAPARRALRIEPAQALRLE